MPVDKTFENEVRITNDDRGRLDLTKQLETKDKEIQTLQQIIINLKNIIDTKEAEITTYKSVNDSHKKLNGELRQEIQELKKQAYDMLLYPLFYLVIQYIENTLKKYLSFLSMCLLSMYFCFWYLVLNMNLMVLIQLHQHLNM